MRPYLSHEHPIRLAHRGSRLLWPENTMTAFQGAVDLGYRYLEIDLHVTRDGRIVIFHDHDLERLTDGRGKVWEWRWEDLRGLDAGHNFDPEAGYPRRGKDDRIPLLEEALVAFPDRMFNLDLKQRGIEVVVAGEIARLGAEERVLIGSFHGRRTRRFIRASGGRVATSASPSQVAIAAAAGRIGRSAGARADVYQIPSRPRGVLDRVLRSAHLADRQVHAWTVNDPIEMKDLLDGGVDGIVTDRPDLLNQVIAERGTP